MHVFGDPAALFAEPQSEVSRIGDGTQLIGLLEDRDALIVADAALLMRIADAVSTTLATCRAAVVLVGTAEDVTPALAAFPSVPAVLVAPISNLALERASRFARETAGRKSRFPLLRASSRDATSSCPNSTRSARRSPPNATSAASSP
jgi:hypothetical protein